MALGRRERISPNRGTRIGNLRVALTNLAPLEERWWSTATAIAAFLAAGRRRQFTALAAIGGATAAAQRVSDVSIDPIRQRVAKLLRGVTVLLHDFGAVVKLTVSEFRAEVLTVRSFAPVIVQVIVQGIVQGIVQNHLCFEDVLCPNRAFIPVRRRSPGFRFIPSLRVSRSLFRQQSRVRT